MSNRKLLGSVLLTLVLYVSQANAQVTLPFAPTDAELSALPRECRSRTAKVKSPALTVEWKMYESRLGRPVWDHYHHYCFALNFMRRTQFATLKKDKMYNLQSAINNYNYLLRHWPPNSPMRIRAESGKREAELMMKLI